jgi:vacuolar-type H+-ATPase subunit C/Vma6
MTDLITVGARARGLGMRLFGRAELEDLAGPDLEGLARALARSARLEPIGTPVTVAAVESAVRRTAANHLHTLARWSGADPVLEVFYAEEDRRSLRALVRGALEGAPSEARTFGLVPTPALPEGVLGALSREPTPGKVAAHLFVLGHPEGRRLLDATAGAHPVLLDLELALLRGLVWRTRRGARAGDANLVSYTRELVDVCNAQMALLLATGPRDVPVETCFVDGGRWLALDAFVRAAEGATIGEVAARLSRALADTPLAPALHNVANAAALETAALRLALDRQRHAARLDPLGSAPLVRFLLRLRAQGMDLLRLAWGASLGAPATLVRAELVTPWS